jgi:hypothetical protein
MNSLLCLLSLVKYFPILMPYQPYAPSASFMQECSGEAVTEAEHPAPCKNMSNMPIHIVLQDTGNPCKLHNAASNVPLSSQQCLLHNPLTSAPPLSLAFSAEVAAWSPEMPRSSSNSASNLEASACRAAARCGSV